MSARPSSDKERAALKLATLSAVTMAGGGAALFANGLVRVNPSMLSLYANPQEDKRFCPIDVALDLDRICGEPFHMRALNTALGFPLPQRATAVPASVEIGIADVLALIRQARDVELGVLAAVEDGQMTRDEKKIVKCEIAELRAALDTLEAKVDLAMSAGSAVLEAVLDRVQTALVGLDHDEGLKVLAAAVALVANQASPDCLDCAAEAIDATADAAHNALAQRRAMDGVRH